MIKKACFDFSGTRWLTPGEQHEVIARLIASGLVAWDNQRIWTLKNGCTTDIYINLRLMRNDPAMIEFLAERFANPLRRLAVDRFVEVPDAVSMLAGHLAVIAGIPVVTIREQEKLGRVVKGKVVGDVHYGERVAIVDDVATDCASKLAALYELRRIGAQVVAIVVLVDRQQGWRQLLDDNDFSDVNVWAGMTLHDVRKFLVQKGIMERCNPTVEAKNPIIVALDGKTWEEALPIIDQLRPSAAILKVNDLLLDHSINALITDLSVYGRVMVDPKWHDIPNTVANCCRRLRATPPWGVTVHANGGREMIRAAVEALAGTPTMVLVVTLLTSISADGCEEIYTCQPLTVVEKLVRLAYEAGARGFVCSTEEAAMIRQQFSDVTIVVPGLRSPGKDAQDQKRVGTYAGAKEAGANFFVGGRQFLTAPDPVAEIRRVISEELSISL